MQVPPHRRRWLIVAALFVVTFGISMPLAAYGVFLPIIAETFGWSRGAISTALSINLILGGLAGFFVGRMADRHGPRVMLFLTVGFAGTGFGLVSQVAALWQLYVLVGLLGGIGMSSFYLLSAATVARWFDDRRGLAIALVLVGFNIGYIVAGPLAAWLIARVGWRSAYATIGFGCACVAVLAASSVRLPRSDEAAALRMAVTSRVADAPSGVGGLTAREALTDPRQWCLNGAWLLLGAVIFTVGVHAVPYVRDHGVSLAAASLALTAYGIGTVAARLISGALSDRFGTHATMRVGYIVEIVALTMLASGTTPRTLLLAMVLFGVGAATTDTMLVRTIPDVFGLRALGAIMGILTLGWRSGAATGPAVTGFIYDATGSYAIPFWAAPVAALLSWILFAAATRHPARR
jgi:MFS family permease